jgi:hypothetical protein
MNTELDYGTVESFVKQQRKKGSHIKWEGWDLLIWRPNSNGFTDQNGVYRRDVFRKGAWGIQYRVRVNNKGIWSVPARYVK